MTPWISKIHNKTKEIRLLAQYEKRTAEYVVRCFTCQYVKAIHQHLAGLLQPITISKWKWETITMNLIVALPRTKQIMIPLWW